ncbi:helix-turn-helix domain-containing protein [Streptomyces sp. NPDC013978]|uniref:helix-turn-helix domain-containing protein n=1 Tax=Streptomyces sp. NPDC013978 TaxID=3364869 RepID=UPI00370124E2
MAEIHDDVAEFALLLTRLKERTDRSYAALGRRLGMNASTLHRYCAGEAVPQDFSGIEQFAALCGASPEERVEVHRRWILAVAARQRSRSSDARRAPTPTTTTTRTGSSSAPANSHSTVHETTAPPAPRPAPTSPSDARPAPTTSPARRPHTGRPRRRAVRSIALAASLAVALACLAASAAGPPSGGRGSSASAGSTPQPSTSSGHSDAGPQAAADPSSGGGGPSASAPAATDSVDDGGTRKNRTDADTVPPPATPLTWTANSHMWAQLECSHAYVMAKPPRQVPPPPAPQDNEVWAASLGAVHGRNTPVRITVQGRGPAAVVLEALHVRVVNRTTTPAADRAAAYSIGDGCGAGLEPRYFSVDLDAPRPLPRAVPAGRPDSPSYAVDFPYRVSLQEPEVLLVDAGTESCTCDWYLELDWSSQGRSGTVRIDDHGRPFRTTTVEGLPQYRYDDASGWVPMTTTYDEAGADDQGGGPGPEEAPSPSARSTEPSALKRARPEDPARNQ